MEKEMKELLDHEHYADLNAAEKAQLVELCADEEDFANLKELFSGIEKTRTEVFTPSARSKESLDELFERTYGKKNRILWYNSVFTVLYPSERPVYRRPLVQIAAALLIVLLTIPLLNRVDVGNNKTVLAKQTTVKENEQVVPEIQDKTEVKNVPVVEPSPAEQTLKNSVIEENKESYETVETASLTIASDFSSSSGAAPTAAMVESAFDHPDGIFTGTSANFSRSARKQLQALDLLTPTF
ncbi:MAG: hypothetical protein ACK45H_15210 [Bacteroidota bacterium]|jgi:hypothetical protein